MPEPLHWSFTYQRHLVGRCRRHRSVEFRLGGGKQEETETRDVYVTHSQVCFFSMVTKKLQETAELLTFDELMYGGDVMVMSQLDATRCILQRRLDTRAEYPTFGSA